VGDPSRGFSLLGHAMVRNRPDDHEDRQRNAESESDFGPDVPFHWGVLSGDWVGLTFNFFMHDDFRIRQDAVEIQHHEALHADPFEIVRADTGERR